MRITASDVARWSGGRLIGSDATADGASFDSRTISPGQFFVAVRGERDGHDHVAGAVTAGAAFVRVRGLHGLQMSHYLMSEALGMILMDGIDPQVVHGAFSSFPEWLAALPADLRPPPAA